MAIVDEQDQPLRVLERHEYPVASLGEEKLELSAAVHDVLAERRRQISPAKMADLNILPITPVPDHADGLPVAEPAPGCTVPPDDFRRRKWQA